MAKLPQYERQSPLMAAVPELRTPQFEASINREKSIQGALDTIGKFAGEMAGREVVKEAEQYTVANPITIDQLNAAKEDGINPIEAALNGGLKWNDAITKLYGKQASAELTNEAYKHFDNVLARVQSGELTAEDQIRESLEAPLKSWRNVIAQIDPEAANTFYVQGVTNGSSYFRKSLNELRTKEQERQDLISDESYRGLVRQFEIDLESGLAPEIILQKYLNDKQKAKDLFKNSSRSATLQAQVDEQFTTALFRHMSKVFQTKYGSKDEFLDAAAKSDLGEYSDIYKQLTPKQKDSLEDYVSTDFVRIDSANNKALTALASNGKSIRDALIEGDNPDRYKDDIADYQKSSDNISGPNKAAALNDIALTQTTVATANKMRSLDLNGMSRHIEDLKARGESEAVIEIAESFLKKAQTAQRQDSVDYVLTRKDAEYGIIEYDPATGVVALGGFADQIAAVKSSPDYVTGGPLLTRDQEAQLIQTLTNPDGATNENQMTTAAQIVAIFGDDADAVFNQIAAKNPVFAHMGMLVIDGSPDVQNTMRKMTQGKRISELRKINIDNKFRNSKSATQFISGVGVSHQADADRILAAAEAYYIGEKGEQGDFETIDDATVERALFAVTGGYEANGTRYGGTTTVNGRMIMIDGEQKTDEVEQYIQDLPVSAFALAFVNNPDPTKSTIEGYQGNEILSYSADDLNEASLQNYGDYYVLVAANGVPFKDITGKEILLDLNVMREIWLNQQYLGLLDQEIARGTGRGLERDQMRRQEEYAKRRQKELEGEVEEVPYKQQQIKDTNERAKKAREKSNKDKK